METFRESKESENQAGIVTGKNFKIKPQNTGLLTHNHNFKIL
jgi:hypothetical protein